MKIPSPKDESDVYSPIIKRTTATVPLNSGQATGEYVTTIPFDKLVSCFMQYTDDVYYTNVNYAVKNQNSKADIIVRVISTTPTANRSYTFILWYYE